MPTRWRKEELLIIVERFKQPSLTGANHYSVLVACGVPEVVDLTNRITEQKTCLNQLILFLRCIGTVLNLLPVENVSRQFNIGHQTSEQLIGRYSSVHFSSMKI